MARSGRAADRLRRRRRVRGARRRQRPGARRALRRGGERHHAAGAFLDADAVRSGRTAGRPTRSTATASPARKSCGAPTARFEIVIAPRARAGNWLPTGGVERYMLVLRLYDTPVGGRDAHRTRRADAVDHARELPMIRLALWMLGGVLLGGIVHLAHRAGAAAHRDPGRLLAARADHAGQCGRARCRCRRPISAVLPFMDPAFAVAVCRYDLTETPAQAHRRRSAKPTRRSRSIPASASPTTRSTIAPPDGA